jgi:hypothetical protein
LRIDFEIQSNLIVASHVTGIYDVNRNTTLANDDFSLVADWARSIEALQLQGIIFHNNFSKATCQLQQSEHIHFVKIDYHAQYNPNVFRYFVYDAFLKSHGHLIKNIFFTDVSDVVVNKNPFLEKIYLEHPTHIFCGDENEILDNAWMQNHSRHLRSRISDYALYETNFKNETLLNCGIMGGNMAVMHPFIEQLKAIHQAHNFDNDTAYTGDMGAFNYLARTRYHDKIMHVYPVNTEFKKYSTDLSCWFKHK